MQGKGETVELRLDARPLSAVSVVGTASTDAVSGATAVVGWLDVTPGLAKIAGLGWGSPGTSGVVAGGAVAVSAGVPPGAPVGGTGDGSAGPPVVGVLAAVGTTSGGVPSTVGGKVPVASPVGAAVVAGEVAVAVGVVVIPVGKGVGEGPGGGDVWAGGGVRVGLGGGAVTGAPEGVGVGIVWFGGRAWTVASPPGAWAKSQRVRVTRTAKANPLLSKSVRFMVIPCLSHNATKSRDLCAGQCRRARKGADQPTPTLLDPRLPVAELESKKARLQSPAVCRRAGSS